MSRSRVVVLCVAVGLSALVADSTAALTIGLRPPIFDGTLLVVVIIMSVACWITYGIAVRIDRLQRCDRRQRVQNFASSIHYIDGDDRTSSGSWHPPTLD